MNNKLFSIGTILALILLGGASIVAFNHNRLNIAEADEIEAVKTTVMQFGGKLKMVSLLAPESDKDEAITQNYSKFVSPTLLEEWKGDSSTTPGKTVSSPWPDRIEIGTVTKNNDGSYRVDGSVVEITSASQAGLVASYPVALSVSKLGGEWVITSFGRGEYALLPGKISIIGVYECLPHKNKDGPQTLECALGIVREGSNEHYALDLAAFSDQSFGEFSTGERVRIEGTLETVRELGVDRFQKYDIRGIIHVSNVSSPDNSGTVRTITQDDRGKTITIKKGDTFLLKLGEMNWDVKLSDPAIVGLTKSASVPEGGQGVYLAVTRGTTVLSAEGRPVCAPGAMCAQYIVSFSVTIVVSQ